MTKQYWTYEDVATVLGVHPKTVKHWVAEGRLRPARLGARTVRFFAEDIEQFMRDARDEEAQPA